MGRGGATKRAERKVRQSCSWRNSHATKRTPLGALAASVSVGIISTYRVEVNARVVEEGSPADYMMLPLVGTRETVCSSGPVKEACIANASMWVVVTLVAHAWELLTGAGSARRVAARAVVVPPI